MDKKKLGVVIVVVALAAIVVSGATTQWWGLGSGQDVAEEGEYEYTTIELIASNPNDREDVSWIKVDVWFVDPDSNFDPNDEETLRPDNLDTYFDLEKDGVRAEDIQLDLSDYNNYFYIVTDNDNDTVFENDYHLKYGGYNRPIEIFVHHLPSNVYFENNLLSDGTRGVPTASGNYTVSMTGYPLHTSWTNKHVGDNWEISSTEFSEMSASEQEYYLNEENFCHSAPTYNPTLDNYKYADHDDLSKWTKTPAYKIKFNETIGNDGSVTDVNVSVDSNDVDVLIDGQYVYFAILRDVLPGFTIDYTLELGANITGSNMYNGILTAPSYNENGISFNANAYSL